MVLETATQNQGGVVANKMSHNFKCRGQHFIIILCDSFLYLYPTYDNIISILVSLRTPEQFYSYIQSSKFYFIEIILSSYLATYLFLHK